MTNSETSTTAMISTTKKPHRKHVVWNADEALQIAQAMAALRHASVEDGPMSDRQLLKLVRLAQSCLTIERQRDITCWAMVSPKLVDHLKVTLEAEVPSAQGAVQPPVDQTASLGSSLEEVDGGMPPDAGHSLPESWAEPEIEASIERLISARFGVQCLPALVVTDNASTSSVHACVVLEEADLTQRDAPAQTSNHMEKAVLKALESPAIERAIMRMVQRALAGAMKGAAAALAEQQ